MGTPEEQLADYNRAVEMLQAQERDHQAAVSIIIAQGHEDMGVEIFDQISEEPRGLRDGPRAASRAAKKTGRLSPAAT
jgi:hypothetical protein